MVKLKLQRVGKRNQAYFRIIAIDSRKTPRSEALEILGSFDPKVEPFKIEVKEERVKDWLEKGAQTTETVQLLLEKAGILPKVKREPRKTPSKASKKGEEEAGNQPDQSKAKKESPAESKPEDTKKDEEKKGDTEVKEGKGEDKGKSEEKPDDKGSSKKPKEEKDNPKPNPKKDSEEPKEKEEK